MTRRTAPDRTEWKLAELAEDAGVSARTVRYYVQRGLLPPPVFRGPDTAYGRDHLLRLRAIQRLQEAYLPLDAIQERLDRLGSTELEEIAQGAAPSRPIPAPPSRTGDPRPRTSSPAAPASWERWTVAPGLEIHVSREASHDVRELAERLRREAQHGRKES